MLELKNIDKYYNMGTVNESQIFDKFNLKVEDEQFVSIIGSNGSGKTSMLNIICGSIPLDGGSIMIDGEDITNKHEHLRYAHMGRVFQSPGMGTSPSMTLLENMSMADNKGKSWNLSRGVNKKRVDYYKSLLAPVGLGLENKLHEKVHSLSGGQRQAVALLMATMTPIKFLILDEHTAALDPKTADIIMEITDRIVKEKKLTALMVTHNLRYSLKYGNRILMMHDGKVILDKKDAEKQEVQMDDILDRFNKISIEVGNSI
ncbi:MAG: ATP-binding cassette domain-containing protein [Peptoniphilus sp.]|nr:ATP-binding cassette domain-containing protein [Peptoniphilus sp.]